MSVLLPNITFDIWRGSFTLSTGVTSAESLYLRDQIGHVHWDSEVDYVRTSPSSLVTDYTFYVDLYLDIKNYDIIKNIRLLDGITPWLPVSANEFWRVIFTEYSPPPFIPHKDIHVQRFTGGGPSI